MRYLDLGSGILAMLDDADYEFARDYTWHVLRSKHNVGFYVQRKLTVSDEITCRKWRMLHRELLGIPDGDKRCVRFNDSNGLNCQRSNLRIIARKDIQIHRKKRMKSSSRYTGVHARDGGWTAIPGYRVTWRSEYSASIARDMEQLRRFGDLSHAGLNHPDLVLNRPARAGYILRIDRMLASRQRWFGMIGSVEWQTYKKKDRSGRKRTVGRYYASVMFDDYKLYIGGHDDEASARATIKNWISDAQPESFWPQTTRVSGKVAWTVPRPWVHPDAWPSKPSISYSPRTRRSCVVP
jgi:hypothetical protein